MPTRILRITKEKLDDAVNLQPSQKSVFETQKPVLMKSVVEFPMVFHSKASTSVLASLDAISFLSILKKKFFFYNIYIFVRGHFLVDFLFNILRTERV